VNYQQLLARDLFFILGMTAAWTAHAAGASPEAVRLLEKLSANYRLEAPYAVELETEVTYLEKARPFKSDGEIRVERVYCDRERVDYQRVAWNVANGGKEPHWRTRHIWADGWLLSRDQSLGRGLRTLYVTYTKDPSRLDRFVRSRHHPGGCLDAFLPSDRASLVDVFMGSANVKLEHGVRADRGDAFTVISCENASGRYSIWLDPERCLLHKVVLSKGAGHTYYDETLPLHVQNFSIDLTEVRTEVHSFEYRLIEGRNVAVAGVMDVWKFYSDASRERVRHTIKRPRMEFAPDFVQLKAFEMDLIPEDYTVYVSGPAAHLPHVWRGGKVVLDEQEAVARTIDETLAKEKPTSHSVTPQ
jgi:hypothetical protein